jgi:uracil-DNA glycosylase family protein
MVGEQPGDREDLEGAPFVGPAGKVLHEAMLDAGIDAADAYLTNAVKHFKFEQRGRVRLHKKPSVSEVRACAPWLEAEIRAVRPGLVVALGATAVQALLGPEVKVLRDRGVVQLREDGLGVVPTVHPSSILRAPDAASRIEQRARFVDDLVRANELAPAAKRPKS